MPKTGRPRIIKITPEVFEGMCRVQCTAQEIAHILGCSIDTLSRWVRRNYKATFAEVYKNHSEVGKMSLRRAQMKLAESGNATMLIWCGKQYLGQTDKVEVDHRIASDIESELARLGLAEAEGVSATPAADTDSRLVN